MSIFEFWGPLPAFSKFMGKLQPPFFIFGPGGIAPGPSIRACLLLPTFRDNSWWLWHSHSGVEDSSRAGRFALSTGQFTFIFRANSPLRSTVTLHQSTGRNLHQHLCKNATSHNRRLCQAELICMTRLLRICEDNSFRALWYIKTLVNTNKCTMLQFIHSITCRSELKEYVDYRIVHLLILKNIVRSMRNLPAGSFFYWHLWTEILCAILSEIFSLMGYYVACIAS